MSSYKVVSGYTIGTPYEEMSKNLKESLVKFNVDHEIIGYNSYGTWEKNCQQKAIIIRDALMKYRIPIVWIDADAVLNAPPIFFDTLDCDVCCHFLKTSYNPNELLTGTIYFKYNAMVLGLIEKWIFRNTSNSAFDQKNLQEVIGCFSGKIEPLPKEYIKIHQHELHQGQIACPVITHYQASRKYRYQ